MFSAGAFIASVASGEEADGDLADGQEGLEPVGHIAEVVLIEELGIVDEHEDRDRVGGDLGGVVNAGPGGAGAFGAGAFVADDLEGLVESAGADTRGGLLEQLGREVHHGLDVLAGRGRGKGDRGVFQDGEHSREVVLVVARGRGRPWPGPTC